MIGELEARSDSGDSEAQFQLAQILQHGLGVPIDESRALKLYHSAAAQSYERAQFALGEIYMEGRITPQDLVYSYMWFWKVRDCGGALALAAANSCEELTPYLSSDQRSEATERARDDFTAGGSDQ